MHPRQLIRETVRDILIAANTAAGANVRIEPLDSLSLRKTDLPVIAIWQTDDTVTDQLPDQARERTQEITTTIEAIVAFGDDGIDKRDDIDLEIRAAIDANRYLRPPVPPPGYEEGDVATDSRLTDTVLARTKTGDGFGAYLGMIWAMEYRDSASVPPTSPDEFLIAGTTYDPNAATDPGDQPKDEILVRGAP